MAKEQNKAIEDIRRFSLLVKKDYKVRKIFLFGSYVSGTNRTDSDIDVAVVIDGLEKMDEIKVQSSLFEKTKKINTRIEPFCISYKDYLSPIPASIISKVIKSGINVIG